MKAKLVINNVNETEKIGLIISNIVFEGFLLLLGGELGAGKTRLSKAIGKGLGIESTIKSPTFNILKYYDEGRLPLYHIDAYRLEGIHQDLGFEECIEGEGVCIIEWFKYIEDILPSDYLKIEISIIDEDKREFTFSCNGNRYEEVLKKVLYLWK